MKYETIKLDGVEYDLVPHNKQQKAQKSDEHYKRKYPQLYEEISKLSSYTDNTIIDFFERPGMIDWKSLTSRSELVKFSEEFTDFFYENLQPLLVRIDYYDFSDKFFETHAKEIDWSLLSYHKEMDIDFVRKFKEYINFNSLISSEQLDLGESLFEEFDSYINIANIDPCYFISFSEDFFQDRIYDLDWEDISNGPLTISFLNKFKEHIIWETYVGRSDTWDQLREVIFAGLEKLSEQEECQD